VIANEMEMLDAKGAREDAASGAPATDGVPF
jgi:hypothetical protein